MRDLIAGLPELMNAEERNPETIEQLTNLFEQCINLSFLGEAQVRKYFDSAVAGLKVAGLPGHGKMSSIGPLIVACLAQVMAISIARHASLLSNAVGETLNALEQATNALVR